jgi:hypothetical protein
MYSLNGAHLIFHLGMYICVRICGSVHYSYELVHIKQTPIKDTVQWDGSSWK